MGRRTIYDVWWTPRTSSVSRSCSMWSTTIFARTDLTSRRLQAVLPFATAPKPVGPTLNFDGPQSEIVRRFFIENALHWIHEYHFDGLRLDATHAIVDESPAHFLAELTLTVERSMQKKRRRVLIIAEDDRNLACIATPRNSGGWGLDAAWADDLHHEIHRCLTGERDGYFADLPRTMADIATTVQQAPPSPAHLANVYRSARVAQHCVSSGSYPRFDRSWAGDAGQRDREKSVASERLAALVAKGSGDPTLYRGSCFGLQRKGVRC